MRGFILAALVAAVPSGGATAHDAAAPRAEQGAAGQGSEAGAEAQPKSEADRKLEEDIARELGAPKPATPPVPGSAGTQGSATGGATPGSPAAQAQSATGGNPLARLLLLPDISAIGDFAGAYDTQDVARLSPRSGPFGDPHKVTPLFREVELGLQSVVDPYARADIFISFGPDGVDVEEAYLTSLSLPAGFQVRAGKLLSPFGRLNQQHPHVWDFVDAPLAMDRLLAADGLKGPGIDVAWLAPLPWYAELHLAGQTTRPGFLAEDRRTLVARLQQFFDVASGTTIGVGLSGATVEEPAPGATDLVGGADVFVKIRPVAGRSYVVLQGELFARRVTGTEDAGTRTGGYAQAVYRDGPYLAYGIRGEIAPAVLPGTPTVTDGSGTEHRVSALATWLPSEFQRLRAQLAWDRLPGGVNGFEALLHLEFVIGSHGAHPF